jgi:alanyl-tRNA synthetase
MTHRLYYADSNKREFEALVVSVDREGGRTNVRLDRTAFYPTSGGQPSDTGILKAVADAQGSVRVIDVLEDGAGDVVHVIDADGLSALQPGQKVHGVIDWPRRFDHMQQHTGQHILSAAFDRLFSVRTVSFHLGAGSCTIDLSRETTPSEIAAAEAEANMIVWQDRPLSVRFVTPEEASALPLRKEPARGGTLRLIDIEAFDLSACGGTHVARTGAVGLIAATAWERFKGGQRLEFVCGARALDRLQSLRDQMAAGLRLLSVLPSELAPAIERLQGEVKEAKRVLAGLHGALATYRAQEMAAAAEALPCGLAVLRALDADAAELKAIASALTAAPGRVAVLVSEKRPAIAVVAVSSDAGVAANQLLTALTTRFGGRGGGKTDLAQGGGLDATPQAILDEARAFLVRTAADSPSDAT